MSSNYRSTKLACYGGYIVQAIVNNFLPILFVVLQTDYKLSYESLGRIVLINFCTQMAADVITPFLTARLGYRKTACLSQLLAAVGLILLAILPGVIPSAYIGIVISVIIYAFGSGIMEVVLSPLMELLPSKNKSASMAFLHSFYCWGQAFTVIVTTLLVHLLGGGGWRLVPLIWAVVPIIVGISFTAVAVVEPPAEQKGGTLRGAVNTRDFWCFVVFMICTGASEIAMAEWASMFVQKGLGINKVTGDLLGPCAFAVCQGIGRVVFGAFSGRFSVRRVLIFNNILCTVCYLLVALCDIRAVAVIACALTGFSVSLSWPGTYSLAAERFKNGGTLMFSVFALCGDIGCSLGPWLLGIIADTAGLKTGFLVCSLFPAIMVAAALIYNDNRMQDKEKDCKSSGAMVE